MENNYSSYPDSHDSSPRSREIDCENPSWDELPSNYKVRFMCSYGGKIHPRPHDNQLAYVGGDTKILTVDRGIRFSDFVSRLSSLCGGSDVCFKYQLPGEDLDALISVTNDEDLEHMMLEYDRLYRASAKPARLRLFLFQAIPPSAAAFGTADPKSERQWFVDALNSVQIQNPEISSPPAAAAAAGNPDFLFGFDKGIPPNPPTKLHDLAPPTVPDAFPKDIHAGLDSRSDDRHVIANPADIQRQIHELQRLQIAGHEQAMLQRKNDPRSYPSEYLAQKTPETLPPPAPPSAVPVTVPAGAYWQERHVPTSGYAVAGSAGSDQPMYIIPTPGGYQAATVGPVTGQVGQAYYGVPRVGPMVYREQPVYNAVPGPPPAPHQQQRTVGGYHESVGTVRSSGVGATAAESGHTQAPYDGVSGRQVYYTVAAGGGAPPYQAAPDGRQAGVVGPEGKAGALKAPPQASSI